MKILIIDYFMLKHVYLINSFGAFGDYSRLLVDITSCNDVIKTASQSCQPKSL